MDGERNPNIILRRERQLRGWSQQKVAELVGTSEDVVSRWERGERKPSPFFQEKLCTLYARNAEELGFIDVVPALIPTSTHKQQSNFDNKMSHTTESEHFSFGHIRTTWFTIEGDGINAYQPENIRTYFVSCPDDLPQDLAERKDQIEKKQRFNRFHGLPFQWNGERYSLDKFVLSRDGSSEDLSLDLWFKPSDYYTFLATNMSLDDKTLRETYLRDITWNEPIRFFSNSFGVYFVVITSDNFTLLTRRNIGLGSRPGEYNVSLCEGLDKQDARSYGGAPDIYSCAERGLKEELGLSIPDDFSPANISFLSLGVDTHYAQWCLLGMVKVYRTVEEIINYRKSGIKDKWENAQIYDIKFNPDCILPFVFQHTPWAPGALACLYYAMVHTFGQSRVREAIRKAIECFRVIR